MFFVAIKKQENEKKWEMFFTKKQRAFSSRLYKHILFLSLCEYKRKLQCKKWKKKLDLIISQNRSFSLQTLNF